MNVTDLGLVRNYTAAGAIKPRRIVTFATAEGEVEQATDATKAPAGVSGIAGTDKQGERIDVHLAGVRDVEAAASFDAGSIVAADADGRLVVATTGQYGFVALMSSVGAGQHVSILLQRVKA